jgi:hypothetical protein
MSESTFNITTRSMTQTTIEQILPVSWPKRWIATLTAYDITPIQPGNPDTHATGQSTGALNPLILTGGTYACEFAS